MAIVGSTISVVILLVVVTEVLSQAQEGDIRLLDGGSTLQGRVEIYHEGDWGTICDDGWSYYDAIVVCRQLGFTGDSTARCCALFNSGTGPILLSSLSCSSNEDLLIECDHRGWGSHYCGHYEDAGIVCREPTNEVRLHDGVGELEGRLEVFVNGRWGTVCADDFDKVDGDVVCAQLGYSAADEVHNGTYVNDVLPVMGNVACSGRENYLAECSHSGWGPVEHCQRGAVEVKCRIDFGSDQIRLIGGGPSEGRVEIFFDDEWGTICDDHWDMDEGEVACRQLGFPGVLNVTTGSSYGPGDGPIWLDDMACAGDEQNLALCSHDGWGEFGTCTHEEDAGVVCRLTEIGDVRLAGGSNNFEGRVEIFYGNEWGSLCDIGWTDIDAIVTCRHLGFTNVSNFGEAGIFSSGTGPIWLRNVSCSGNETTLQECADDGWDNIGLCNHDNDVGIVCQGASNKMRLADGKNNLEGRVEIYHNGRWGTVCPDNWDINEVQVVCRYLGYSGDGAVRNDFSGGGGPVWLSGLNCNGNETNIAECEHVGWEISDPGCNHADQAGVVCYVAREGDVRLISVADEIIRTRGRVDIYHNGAWGTVCGRGWDIKDGRVVCRQLGFSKAAFFPPVPDHFYDLGIEPIPDYPPGIGDIWMSNVDCSGEETSLKQCKFSGWGGNDCNHTEDAGIICSDFDLTPPVIYNCPRDLTIIVEIGRRSEPVYWMEPWAVDDSGITTLLTNSHTPGYRFPVGATVVSYVFISPVNNIAACTFTVNAVAVDSTPPEITQCPSDIYSPVINGTSSISVSWSEPKVSDLSGTMLLRRTAVSGDEFPIGSTEVVYIFVDDFDNHAYCNFTVNVLNGGSGQGSMPQTSTNNLDVFNCPTDIMVDVELGTQGEPVYWVDPWANSTSGNVTLLLQTHTSGALFNAGRSSVTYLFMDVARQLSNCTFTVIGRAVDISSPIVIGCTPQISMSYEIGGTLPRVHWLEPTAWDISGNITQTSSHQPGAVFEVGKTNVSYSFADNAGNVATCDIEVNVIVVDTHPPTIRDCPSTINETIELGAGGVPINWTEPLADDASGAVDILLRSHTPGANFANGTSLVTYLFADSSDNVASCIFTVNIETVDTTPPMLSQCPTDMYHNAPRNGKVVWWTRPSAVDLSGDVNMTIYGELDGPGTGFPLGVTMIRYTFSDSAGNEAECMFDIDIQGLPEIVGCPNNIMQTVELGIPNKAVMWEEPSLSSGEHTERAALLFKTHSPGAYFSVGKTDVSYVYADYSSNVVSCTFSVLIRTEDTSPPVITQCPPDIERIATSHSAGTIVTWTEPSATDYSSFTQSKSHEPASLFNIGTTQVMYVFTDAKNHQASCNFDVTIEPVNIAFFEVSNCPADITKTVELGTRSVAIHWKEPTASVTSGNIGNVTMTSRTNIPGDFFVAGETAGVVYEFTNEAGHVVDCSFKVMINTVDTTPPTIHNCPRDIHTGMEVGSRGVSKTWIEPTATDLSGDVIRLVRTHIPNTLFYPGLTVVTYIYADASHNLASCEFNVNTRAEDTSVPLITSCPSNITKSVPQRTPSTTVTWKEPQAIDMSGDVMTRSMSHTSGDRFSIGTTNVVYEFKDSAQNSATCTFDVTIIKETIAQLSSCPSDISVNTSESNLCQATWREPSPLDKSTVLFLRTHSSGFSFPVGDTIVNYIFKDPTNNLITCGFKVTCSISNSPIKHTQPVSDSDQLRISVVSLVVAGFIAICFLICSIYICYNRRSTDIKRSALVEEFENPTFSTITS